MNAHELNDSQVQRLLDPLQPVPPRSLEAQALGRAKFLEQAQSMAREKPMPPAVSPVQKRRLNGWMSIFTRKEPRKMTALASIVLIVSLLFGGAGATVAAAQGSTPDQALYPVKVLSEDARLELTGGAQARLELALAYAHRRADEAARQIQAGAAPQTNLMQRWQSQLNLALKIAAGMPGADMKLALDQIRASVQAQARDMDRLHATGTAEQSRLRIQDMLKDCLNRANLGLQQPEQFRNQSRQGWKGAAPSAQPTQGTGAGNPWTTGTPTPGSGYGPGGQNPWTTGTPTPGSGYGPGGQNPWTTGTSTPGSGYGPGGSQNPWTDGTPTPGSGYGPGPGTGDCQTCTPGSSNGPGPGTNPSQPQPGTGQNPGGNGGQPPSGPKPGGPGKP